MKEQAIKDALVELTRKLRNEFALEKEIAIGEALAKARVGPFSYLLVYNFNTYCILG